MLYIYVLNKVILYDFELLSFNLYCKNLKLKIKSYLLVILYVMKRYFKVC